jgi:hypothetical protein
MGVPILQFLKIRLKKSCTQLSSQLTVFSQLMASVSVQFRQELKECRCRCTATAAESTWYFFPSGEKFAVCLCGGARFVFIVCKTRQRFVNIVKTRRANTDENLPNVGCRRE